MIELTALEIRSWLCECSHKKRTSSNIKSVTQIIFVVRMINKRNNYTKN